MHRWSVRLAKARFSAMLDACVAEGPQLTTRRGNECTVLVRVAEWHCLQADARPSPKLLLLAEEARCTPAIPSRGRARRRATVAAR